MSIREALRQRTRQRWRWRHVQIPLGPHALQLSVDSDGTSDNPGAGSGVDAEGSVRTLQTGEGSVAAEERSHESPKTCENHVNLAEKDPVDKKENVEKANADVGSFFDCNICLDLDDRDSFSSIAAVTHGESQTMDTAVEIDSMVSLSTSSLRKSSVASRASDVDSGDSRTPEEDETLEEGKEGSFL